MKIKKPFNGLTSGEHQRLTEIRMLAHVDLVTAKRAAADWVLSNKRRRVLRQAACRTINRPPGLIATGHFLRPTGARSMSADGMDPPCSRPSQPQSWSRGC